MPSARRLPIRLIGFVLLLGMVLLAGSGCKDASRRSATTAGMERAIVMVNNEPIGYEEFLADYQLFITKWERFIGNDQAKRQEIKEILLTQKINELILDQEARRKGIRINEGQLQARSLALLQPHFKNEQETGPQLPKELLVNWTKDLRRRMIHEKLIQQEVINKIRIKPNEMSIYYKKNESSFVLPERVKVRHLAVGSRQLYNRVMRLIERNKDFVELIEKYSITPDRDIAGELGYLERGVLPEEVDEAIFNMTRIGSISSESKPIQTQIGYHIFKLEDRKPAEKLNYRQAIPEIKRRLTLDKQPEAYQTWLENLKSQASIIIEHNLLNAE